MTTKLREAPAVVRPSVFATASRTLPGASALRFEVVASQGDVVAAGEQAARLAVASLLPPGRTAPRPATMTASSVRFLAPVVAGPLHVYARVVGDPRGLGRRIADEGAALVAVEARLTDERRVSIAEMRTEWVVRSTWQR